MARVFRQTIQDFGCHPLYCVVGTDPWSSEAPTTHRRVLLSETLKEEECVSDWTPRFSPGAARVSTAYYLRYGKYSIERIDQNNKTFTLLGMDPSSGTQTLRAPFDALDCIHDSSAVAHFAELVVALYFDRKSEGVKSPVLSIDS